LLSVGINSFFVVTIALTMVVIRWRSTIIMVQQRGFIKRQNQELEEKNKLLDFNSKHDFLTGLFNRREFVDHAEREAARNQRNSKETWGILIDMDNFKLVNDRFGHPVGDVVLQKVADAIRSSLRVVDISARFGGEEFAILLPETSHDGALLVADRIREAIEKLQVAVGDQEVTVTASLGVAPLRKSFTSFYHAADLALYEAKSGGRNQVVINS